MKKEHIRQIIKNVDEEKKALKEREGQLNKLSSELYNQLYKKFECPLGLSDYEAICPECEHVLPEFTLGSAVDASKGFQRFSLWFPHGYSKEKQEKFVVRAGTHGCREWRKKNITVACGCGGHWECKCGYYEEFCMVLVTGKECPFCGRDLVTDATIWEPIEFIYDNSK